MPGTPLDQKGGKTTVAAFLAATLNLHTSPTTSIYVSLSKRAQKKALQEHALHGMTGNAERGVA